MPDDFASIEAAKEAGMPWFSGSLDDSPLWVRETILAKLSAENKVKRLLYERHRAQMKSGR